MIEKFADSREWTIRAACISGDPDALFVQGAAQHRAKIICMGCEVRTECLAEALDNQIEFGVWGGMTERERRALLRRRPDIVSWAEVLFQARDEHMARNVIDLRSPQQPSRITEGLPSSQLRGDAA